VNLEDVDDLDLSLEDDVVVGDAAGDVGGVLL